MKQYLLMGWMTPGEKMLALLHPPLPRLNIVICKLWPYTFIFWFYGTFPVDSKNQEDCLPKDMHTHKDLNLDIRRQ